MNWDMLDKQREIFHVLTLEGFTSTEYAKRYGVPAATARRHLGVLSKAGRIVFVGVRPGAAQEKAYIVKNAKTNSRPRP